MSRLALKREKHFCASVWMVTKNSPRKILLVHHKKFNKWIQPGGHIEPFENPLETATREVREETGLDISFLRKKIKKVDKEGSFLPTPNFLMEQAIFEKGEDDYHFHLDLEYVVEISEQELKYNPLESNNIGWFTKKEALKLPTHEDTKVVIRKIM